jgi:hypothetical protein
MALGGVVVVVRPLLRGKKKKTIKIKFKKIKTGVAGHPRFFFFKGQKKKQLKKKKIDFNFLLFLFSF